MKVFLSLHLLEDLGVSRKNLLLDRLDFLCGFTTNQLVYFVASINTESDLELAILCCSRAMWLKFLFVRNLKQEAEILTEEF